MLLLLFLVLLRGIGSNVEHWLTTLEFIYYGLSYTKVKYMNIILAIVGTSVVVGREKKKER